MIGEEAVRQHETVRGAILSPILSWGGIVGGAITVFSNLQTLLDLAGWARLLVANWSAWLNVGWSFLFARFNLHLVPSVRSQLTMCAAIIMMAIGSFLSNRNRSNWSPGIHNIIRPNVGIAVAIFVTHAWFFSYYIAQVDAQTLPAWFWRYHSLALYGIYAIALLVGLLHWPMLPAIIATAGGLLFSEAFQSAAGALQPDPQAEESVSVAIGTACSVIAGLIVLGLAPPIAFAKRVIFLLAGLIVLIGLNELSKLGLTVSPPPLPR